tara:strand:+ start:720 stop:1187 length:468 start_codon:yes stop_codon:yes gene_type:complete
MQKFKSLLFKTLSDVSSSEGTNDYLYSMAVWHESNPSTNQYILWSEDIFGSGSADTEYKIISLAAAGCNPISYADNNAPTLEITEEVSNMLATASLDSDNETILDYLEDNYFYHKSSPATSSVEVLNDIHHWLESGSLTNSVGSQTIDTLPTYGI